MCRSGGQFLRAWGMGHREGCASGHPAGHLPHLAHQAHPTQELDHRVQVSHLQVPDRAGLGWRTILDPCFDYMGESWIILRKQATEHVR